MIALLFLGFTIVVICVYAYLASDDNGPDVE